ncbi:MAG: hypothetical protein WCP57_11290 [Bacteroidota bacterium]
MKYRILFVLFIIGMSPAMAQNTTSIKSKKHSFTYYLSWGYNKCWHTRSNIHFQNLNGQVNPKTGLVDYYDFTIYKAKAHDRPNYEGIKDIKNLTIPQYNVRFGIYFNDEMNDGIEISFDHTKYVMSDYQTLRLVGQIYGVPINKDTLIDPNKFLHFEHTDGANFLLVNYLKKFNLCKSKKEWFSLSIVTKYGAGIVIPRTDVRLFGNRINNKFHIAGVVVGVEAGLRATILKYAFVELTSRGTYAYYINSLVQGKQNGSASQRFATLQAILTAGIQVKI